MEKEFDFKKGRKKYEYWMASWRRGSKVHTSIWNLQEARSGTALGKARRIKAKDLGINKSSRKSG